ncbi:MAG: RAM signaling network component [Bathelium mastoideum]|nr:MAG: RAM signaling network component [Bathelium mastoideum]KAI9688584.1 MAG: RAM signaling network component [Bathelium mastoideum]
MSAPSSPSGGARAHVMDLVRETIERDYPDWQKENDEESRLAPDAMGWTIDLSHHDIRILPEEVIHILEDNVRRLAIGHNRLVSVPTCLANCQNLRYFNARNNDIHVFPGALLQMPNLEIIDLSDNKMVGIPDAIEGMPALNALAIASNRIERLPSCLWRMKKLRMIKVHGNPLQYPPAEILEVDAELFDSKIPNAYEMAMTAKVKDWLWNQHKEKMARMRVDLSRGRTRPAALDIAKATRRAHGTRFPVKPSLSGINVDHSVEGEERPHTSLNGRAVHEAAGAKPGHPIRTVSFETPSLATTPVNAPPIPPRSESRTHPHHSSSLSPEGAATITSQRPRLATVPLDLTGDQASVLNSERSHTDSVLQTTNRSNRQARVWRETQSHRDIPHAQRGSIYSPQPIGMADRISDVDYTVELLARVPPNVMNDLDGMARNLLGLWIDVAKSTKVIQMRSQEWYKPEDDQNAVGQALFITLESLGFTRSHLNEYYNFNQPIADYLCYPSTETIRVKFRFEELERWVHTLIRCRLDLEQHRRRLFCMVGRYTTNLRLLPPSSDDSERHACARSAQQALQIALFLTWQDRKNDESDPLADARARFSKFTVAGRIPQSMGISHIFQLPIFTDQEHPYAPIYDKTAAAIELTERLAQHNPPDPERIPAWRTITMCMRLFHSLFLEGDSERLRSVVWRFAHSIAEFQSQGLQLGEGLLIKEFLEPIDMVIEAVRMFSLTGFTGK